MTYHHAVSGDALRILRVVLSFNECALVLAESYFDETNTHSADKRLCVGGYVFLSDAAEEQARRWLANNERWGLPYFHMVECAHNTGIYAHLTEEECDLAAREAIKIIKETASQGVCVTVLAADYDELMPPLNFLGSAYDHCARAVITGVANWIGRSQFSGDMHYFFEAGVDTQSAASASILEMMRDADIRREARYVGHTFIEKARSPGVQAADLLAWHAGQDCARAERGDPMRKDFQSLNEIPHVCLHLTRSKLQELSDIVQEEVGGSGLAVDDLNAINKLVRSNPKKWRR
jgi:hypothetical protein